MVTDHTNYSGKTRIKTQLPISFETLSKDRIHATVKQIEFTAEPDTQACELTFELSYEDYVRVTANEAFHLFDSLANGEELFEADQPIVVRAGLRPTLARQLAKAGADAEDVLRAMLPDEARDRELAPLYHTECWLAMEVTQVQPLPPELQEEGQLRAGFRTEWHELFRSGAFSANARSTEPAADAADHLTSERQSGLRTDDVQERSLKQQVEQFLRARDLHYDLFGDKIIRMRFTSEAQGEWRCLIRLEEEQQQCIIYSVFPDPIPEPLRNQIALTLMSENYDLTPGNFEMDDEDGELRFRSTLFADAAHVLDSDVFATVLAIHIRVMEHFLPLVRSFTQAE